MLAAWAITYFNKWNLPFLYALLIIALLFFLNLIYDYHLEYQSFQELNDKYEDLKTEPDDSSSVSIEDKERGISLKVNGKIIDDPDLKEIIHITLERYKRSNEEERKKWIQQGKDEEDNYILTHKW